MSTYLSRQGGNMSRVPPKRLHTFQAKEETIRNRQKPDQAVPPKRRHTFQAKEETRKKKMKTLAGFLRNVDITFNNTALELRRPYSSVTATIKSNQNSKLLTSLTVLPKDSCRWCSGLSLVTGHTLDIPTERSWNDAVIFPTPKYSCLT
jgi:hypothetical protein